MRSWSSVPQASGNVSGPPLPPPRHDPPARAPTDPQPPRRPAPTCPLPGLARETGEVEELQAELAKIQAEQDALPALVKEVQDALEAEAAAFQRQEAGGHPGLPWDRSGAAPAEACAGLLVCVMHGARLCTGFASCQRGCRRLLLYAAPHMTHGVLCSCMHTKACTQGSCWCIPPASYPACAAALSNQESLKERKLGALHQALAMYRSRLGLEFVHGERLAAGRLLCCLCWL